MVPAENRRHILPVGRCGSYEGGGFSRGCVSLRAIDGIAIAPVSADDSQEETPHDDF